MCLYQTEQVLKKLIVVLQGIEFTQIYLALMQDGVSSYNVVGILPQSSHFSR